MVWLLCLTGSMPHRRLSSFWCHVWAVSASRSCKQRSTYVQAWAVSLVDGRGCVAWRGGGGRGPAAGREKSSGCGAWWTCIRSCQDGTRPSLPAPVPVAPAGPSTTPAGCSAPCPCHAHIATRRLLSPRWEGRVKGEESAGLSARGPRAASVHRPPHNMGWMGHTSMVCMDTPHAQYESESEQCSVRGRGKLGQYASQLRRRTLQHMRLRPAGPRATAPLCLHGPQAPVQLCMLRASATSPPHR